MFITEEQRQNREVWEVHNETPNDPDHVDVWVATFADKSEAQSYVDNYGLITKT